ncbi:MAG TPA: hypothetical protein VFK34_09660 [Marmoricola sp.]|jgi:hypothetical protein|nr:hypothetical protein [Marmoricola sp.]
MGNDNHEQLGEVDEAEEAAEPSSTTEGPAAEGDYDPTQGSPDSGAHPVGQEYPDEATGTGDDERTRSASAE